LLDHAWDYTDDTYLHNLSHLQSLQKQGKISHIGVTNTDAAHLELLLDSGVKIATNQVSCSVIDRRVVNGRLSPVCLKHGVGILAYGTLLGGYLSEKWLGKREPQDIESLNWSLRKYLRFIRAAGGWDAYQVILQALDTIAKKHNVPIAAVATRYVLDLPAVSAVLVGTRLSSESDKYTASNLAAFSFQLSEEDNALIRRAQGGLSDIPGDCGDEYRRAPYLTVSGDLSHHLDEDSKNKRGELIKAVKQGARIEYSSGNPWEPIAVKSSSLSSYRIFSNMISCRATAVLFALATQFASQAQQLVPRFPVSPPSEAPPLALKQWLSLTSSRAHFKLSVAHYLMLSERGL
jgi:diketogulonate reductase-like aldo/keto reductase